jgi:hypothetical protein
VKSIRLEPEAKQELAAGAVVFIDVGAAIRIVAVAHERRRPGYWLARLR